MSNSIRQQLEWASGVLNSISGSPRLDSEVLLAHCLQKDRSYLLTWPDQELSAQQLACFQEIIKRRLEPQPVAYLVGEREFYSLQLKTTPVTLVPRPETELLVDKTLELIRSSHSPQILELGTGTGAIALAIKQQRPDCRLTATDISQQALEVARLNAQKFQLEIDFIVSDWYQSLDDETQYDVIVSNPPYIAANDPYLSQGDLPAEPQRALCSGETGLEALQQIISGAGSRLKPSGWIVLEHGYDQQQQVQQMLLDKGFQGIVTLKDFNELPRLTMAQYPDIKHQINC